MSKSAIRNGIVIIASLLGLAFAFAACVDDSGDRSISSVCSASCEQFEGCEEDSFDEVYDSMDDCKDLCEDVIDEYIDECDECEGEYLRYYDCVAGLSCSDFEDQDYGDCDDDWEDLGNCLIDNCDSGNTYDNVGACQDAEDAINALPCISDYPVDFSCDSYDGVDCDYADYFDCISDVYYCDGETLSYDDALMQDCSDIADELSSTC